MTVSNADTLLPKELDMADSRLKQILKVVANTLEEHQGIDSTLLDMRGVVDFMDAMVITTGSSNLHNRAIAEHLVESLEESDIFHFTAQDDLDADWVAIDIGYVMVHIQLGELREHYALEELWAAADSYELARSSAV